MARRFSEFVPDNGLKCWQESARDRVRAVSARFGWVAPTRCLPSLWMQRSSLQSWVILCNSRLRRRCARKGVLFAQAFT